MYKVCPEYRMDKQNKATYLRRICLRGRTLGLAIIDIVLSRKLYLMCEVSEEIFDPHVFYT